MTAYTVTYYDPLKDEYAIERYITAGLRDARIHLLYTLGYRIIGTHNPD